MWVFVRLGRRAGGLRRGEYGRAMAQRGHAAVGLAVQEPAELGADAAKAADLVPVEGRVLVVAGGAVRGQEPVLARNAQEAAPGGCQGQGCEEGEQQQLEGQRNLGVQDRPRPGARCFGLVRCGGIVWHPG